jgi:hypothetical protein
MKRQQEFSRSLCYLSRNCFNSLAPFVGTILLSFHLKKKSEMVHTRTLKSGRNNPPPEVGGPSNNDNNAVALESRIAQLSMDMATLTKQNLRLLGPFLGGRISEELDENDRDKSDAHISEDMNSENQWASRDN